MFTMKELTDKQIQILTYIEQYIQNQGYPPTIREIGDEFSITAKGAYDHLKAIEKKGFIKCEKNRSRAIELLKTADGSIQPGAGEVQNVPLVGQVAAGLPLLAEENIEEYLAFPRSMLPESGVFALRVVGESMKDAGILDGDIAIIKKQDIAQNGDIVVALIDDEATLKYLYRDKKRVRLQPANKAFKPIYPQNVQVIGVLMGIYRQY